MPLLQLLKSKKEIIAAVFIASLPFFVGQIIVTQHAYIFGFYLNYLHVRITLQVILSLLVLLSHSQNFQFPKRIFPLPLLLGVFLIISLCNSFLLGNFINNKGLFFLFTSAFYLGQLFLEIIALGLSIRTLTFQKNTAVVTLLFLGLALQGIFITYQIITKTPLFPQFFGWIGQPITFTSFTQIGMFDYARAYGTTPHPNILAAILVFWVIFFLSLETSKVQKLFFLFITAIFIFLTLSRMGILTLFGVISLYLLRRLATKIHLSNLQPIAIGVLCLIFSLLLVPVLAQLFPQSTFITTRSHIEELYLALGKVAPNMLLFGTGFRMSIPALYQNLSQLTVSALFQTRLLIEPPHNIVLLMIIELGIPATILTTLSFGKYFLAITKDKPKWFTLSLMLIIVVFGSFDHLLLY